MFLARYGELHCNGGPKAFLSGHEKREGRWQWFPVCLSLPPSIMHELLERLIIRLGRPGWRRLPGAALDGAVNWMALPLLSRVSVRVNEGEPESRGRKALELGGDARACQLRRSGGGTGSGTRMSRHRHYQLLRNHSPAPYAHSQGAAVCSPRRGTRGWGSKWTLKLILGSRAREHFYPLLTSPKKI